MNDSWIDSKNKTTKSENYIKVLVFISGSTERRTFKTKILFVESKYVEIGRKLVHKPDSLFSTFFKNLNFPTKLIFYSIDFLGNIYSQKLYYLVKTPGYADKPLPENNCYERYVYIRKLKHYIVKVESIYTGQR